jgi:hypothetical protein
MQQIMRKNYLVWGNTTKGKRAKDKECDEKGTLFWTKHKRQEMQECSKVRKMP